MYKFQDEAIANYRTQENMKQAVMRDYGDMIANGLSIWKPITMETLTMRLIGENRIVEVNKLAYDYPIQIVIDKDQYQLEVPVYFARIHGKWTIVR